MPKISNKQLAVQNCSQKLPAWFLRMCNDIPIYSSFIQLYNYKNNLPWVPGFLEICAALSITAKFVKLTPIHNEQYNVSTFYGDEYYHNITVQFTLSENYIGF